MCTNISKIYNKYDAFIILLFELGYFLSFSMYIFSILQNIVIYLCVESRQW